MKPIFVVLSLILVTLIVIAVMQFSSSRTPEKPGTQEIQCELLGGSFEFNGEEWWCNYG